MKVTLISCELDLSSNGLRSLSSQLRKYGHQTKIVFLPRYHESYSQKALEELYELTKDSTLIGFHCMSQSSKKTIQVINYLKSRSENQKMIWGGIYATLNPEECLNHVNIVCVGEGEGAIIELTNTIEKQQDVTQIRNLWIRKDGKIYKNEVRPLIEDINKLPFEDYSFKEHYVLIDNHIMNLIPEHMVYGLHNISNEFFSTIKGKFITMHTTRGCPYNCTYCCNCDLKRLYAGKGRYVRKRSKKNIISELLKFKKDIPEIRFIWFTDDDFFIKTKEEIERFSRLYKEKINLPFMCYVTPTTLEEDKLKILIQSGLSRVEMGIQTGSEKLNKEIYHRSIQTCKVIEASRLLNKYCYFKNPPEYQFICTNPFETKKDLLETLKLIQKLPVPFYLRIFNMTFFPGSYLYKKAIDAGFIKDYNKGCFDIFYCDSASHLDIKKHMPKEELYLSALLNLMQGDCTRLRYGRIPKPLLGILLNEEIISSTKALKLLAKLLYFFPYSIIFWKMPYCLKRVYIKIYSWIYREVYIRLKRITVRMKRKYDAVTHIL